MRILGGNLKGQQISAPKGLATRPTSVASREAIFNIIENSLGHEVSHVWDMFAGSGSLGFEALSRGAESCVFFENAAPAISCLKKNIERFDLRVKTSLLTLGESYLWPKKLKNNSNKINTIFCDPPYADRWAKKLDLFFQKMQSSLSDDCLWVFECSSKLKVEEFTGWELIKKRDSGGAAQVLFYKRVC